MVKLELFVQQRALVFAVLDHQPQMCACYGKEIGLVDAFTLISLLHPLVQATIHQHLLVRKQLHPAFTGRLIHSVSLSAPRSPSVGTVMDTRSVGQK